MEVPDGGAGGQPWRSHRQSGRWPTTTPPTVPPAGPPIFDDRSTREPLVVGTRVRVVRDPVGPGPWPAEPSGRVALYPGTDFASTEVETRWGRERSWWVVFDEPQRDGDGDGPYRESAVLERYLQLLP